MAMAAAPATRTQTVGFRTVEGGVRISKSQMSQAAAIEATGTMEGYHMATRQELSVLLNINGEVRDILERGFVMTEERGFNILPPEISKLGPPVVPKEGPITVTVLGKGLFALAQTVEDEGWVVWVPDGLFETGIGKRE